MANIGQPVKVVTIPDPKPVAVPLPPEERPIAVPDWPKVPVRVPEKVQVR